MKRRNWTVIVGAKRFTMILMDDTEDALTVARSLWPNAEVC